MSPDTLLALFALSAAAAWTPGPNNAMLASAGATFGLRRTLPHVAGIGLGFPFMIFLIALGLGEVFQRSEILRTALRWGGAAMLLWVAWRIAAASGAAGRTARARPFTFLQACAFQWVNPKAWVMAVSITAQFVDPEARLLTSALCAGVFVFTGFGSALTWAGLGQALQGLLSRPGRLRAFNAVMAALILASILVLFAS